MLKVEADLLKKMAQLGFVACRSKALRPHAAAIFECLRAEKPQSPVPVVGMAMVHLNCDKSPQEAVEHMMKNGVGVDEGDMLSRAFLGLFLKMAKRGSEATKVLNGVLDSNNDTTATELAKAVLSEMR